MACLSVAADPSDVDQFGNPGGYVGTQNAPVTDDGCAALDLAMRQDAKRGAINEFYRYRKPMELDKQPAILVNRDTLWSFAIVDALHGLTVQVPGSAWRYISPHVMEHDHTIQEVDCDGGDTTEPDSVTECIGLTFRTLGDPNDTEDVAKAAAIQHVYKIEFSDGVQGCRPDRG